MGSYTLFGTGSMRAKDFVASCVFTPGSDKCDLVDISVKGHVAYCAVRVHATDVIFGLVVKLSRDHGDWCYKDIDEGMGPHYYDCPARILDNLSPTDDETSLEWRRKCRKNIEAKRTRKRPSHGDTVTLDASIRFSDGVFESVFTCEADSHRGRTRLLFRRKSDGMICKITRLARMQYKVSR